VIVRVLVMKRLSAIVCVLGLFAAVYAAYDRPIVGILTQLHDSKRTYIAASYVKWVESAGARAIPLLFERWDDDTLVKMLKSINGVVLPGGGAEIEGRYLDALVTIFNYAKSANDNGDHFPLWGTCLGFEELLILGANDTKILDTGFDSEDLTLALELTQAANASKFFNSMPEYLRKIVTTQKVTYNNHECGISPNHFSGNAKLMSFYDVLSTNQDKQGKPFVSTMEAKKYPFFGVQWHPEKIMFEWATGTQINHSFDSVELNSWTSRFFVNECRMNDHHFVDTQTEKEALIYQFTPTYTGDVSGFMQKYFFPLP